MSVRSSFETSSKQSPRSSLSTGSNEETLQHRFRSKINLLQSCGYQQPRTKFVTVPSSPEVELVRSKRYSPMVTSKSSYPPRLSLGGSKDEMSQTS